MHKTGEFKGNPVITLMRSENDKYPFMFGLAKAKLILEHVAEIRRFVDANSESRG